MSVPAEWERHRATWLSWPHNVRDWPGKFAPIPWVYAEIVRRIAEGETVRILAGGVEAKARAVLKKAEVPLDRVEFLKIPTDRVWTRDSGPIFLKAGVIANFRFNAWAKYPDFKKDQHIPARAAKALGYELRDVGAPVLEGGAIDLNGQGSILVTEECLLDPHVQVRNPGWRKEHYEKLFREVLGARNTIWLGKGIAGDDTHGHIDDLARFVDARTIVLCEDQPENRERLQSAKLEDGSRPEIVSLPVPQPVVFNGQRLPASYANFYVCNAAVLVPVFDDPSDFRAVGLLGELLKRPAIGIHARDLVWGLGTLHCLSQQEPG